MSGEKCDSDVTHLCSCRWWNPSIDMFRMLTACDSFANTAFMTVLYNDTLAWLLVWRNICCIVVTILFIIYACFTNQMDSWDYGKPDNEYPACQQSQKPGAGGMYTGLEWRHATDCSRLAWGTLELPLTTPEVKGTADKYLCLEHHMVTVGHCLVCVWIVHYCIKLLYVFEAVQFAARFDVIMSPCDCTKLILVSSMSMTSYSTVLHLSYTAYVIVPLLHVILVTACTPCLHTQSWFQVCLQCTSL